MRFAAINRTCLVLAAIGITIAGALTMAELSDTVLPCGAESGCRAVAADSAARLAGIPIALFGLCGYAVLFSIGLGRSFAANPKGLTRVGVAVSGLGVSVSSYLLWRSLMVIHAACTWCIASGICMVLLFCLNSALMVVEPSPKVHHRDLGFAAALILLAISSAVVVPKSPRLNGLADSRALARVSERELVPTGAHILGVVSAPLTIVEFADLMCPACRQMNGRLERFVQHNPGRVRLVFRHLPLVGLRGHEASARIAAIAEMSHTDGQFWNFVDQAYAGRISVLKTPKPTARAWQRVQTDMNLAASLRIAQTPTYVIFTPTIRPVVATSTNLLEVIQRPVFMAALR